MTELTQKGITALLAKNNDAVCRALIVLYNNQTADEQSTNTTNQHNGRGFSGFDAEIGTKMAKFYLERKYLTIGQIAVWRKMDRNGNMRIARYWRQLIAAAQEKAAKQLEQDTTFNFGYNTER